MTSRRLTGSCLIRQVSQRDVDWLSQRTGPSCCYLIWPYSQQPLSWLTSTPSAGLPVESSPGARHKVKALALTRHGDAERSHLDGQVEILKIW
jgi:hypothetical protein